jgi:class 3 adenylate cyclase/tetratricopeptide (TPR) repeat protein
VQLLADALQLTDQDRSTFETAGRLLGNASHAEPSQLLESELPFTETEPSTPVRIFLIVDVRGYTRFTVEHGDEAAARLAAKFADLAEEITAAREGTVIELRGDEALVVFASARQALRAAMELQARFVEEGESDPSLPLNAGVGLDAGEAIPLKGGYRGAALNMAARLCTLAGPGEVLASDTVTNLARKVEGLEYADRGMVQVKGFADPVRVMQVVPSSPSAKPVILIEPGERGTGQPRPIGGFLGALPEGEMVARQEELGRILSSVDVVLGGSGRLLVLAGEPGIGKTRLAQEVTLNLRNRSFVVAAGRCYEPRQTVPFYPFLDALATLYEACPPHIRSRVATAWPYLARLLPDELGAAPPPSSEGQEDQERLFRAVTAFLGAISEIIPAALLFDDLHWADGSSVDLLQHLARHTRSSRILLLGTYRDVDVQRHHPLSRALRDLSREHLLERIQLHRLEQGETAALIAATMGEAEVAPALAWLVYQGTNGNPFFVDEVLRALVDRGDLYRQNGRWESREIEEIEVPVSVREAIGERLSRLSETAQKILLEASVLGQTFSFDELQALGSRTEEEVEDALGEAMRAGVVRDIGRDRCTFNHTLTQQALYAELSSRQRRKLHRTAGEALESLPHRGRERRAAKPEYLQAGAQPRRDRATAGWAGELAWHFLEGDDAERALKYALLAGDQAEAVFAHAEAERHYRKAHELACELVDTPREAEAVEKLGTVLKTVSKYDEALGLLEAAARLYRQAGDLERERCSVAEIGRVHYLRGATSEGIERIQSLLEHAEAIGPSQGLAALYTTQATLSAPGA